MLTLWWSAKPSFILRGKELIIHCTCEHRVVNNMTVLPEMDRFDAARWTAWEVYFTRRCVKGKKKEKVYNMQNDSGRKTTYLTPRQPSSFLHRNSNNMWRRAQHYAPAPGSTNIVVCGGLIRCKYTGEREKEAEGKKRSLKSQIKHSIFSHEHINLENWFVNTLNCTNLWLPGGSMGIVCGFWQLSRLICLKQAGNNNKP